MGTPRFFEVVSEGETETVPRVRKATPAYSSVARLVKSSEHRARQIAVSESLSAQPPDLTLPAVAAPSDLEDLPSLVVTKAKVTAREGKVTIKDGLVAQGILERRAERAEDKQFMLNLARALAGGGASGPVPVLGPGPSDDEVEGEFEELSIEDDQSLAPAHLRDPV